MEIIKPINNTSENLVEKKFYCDSHDFGFLLPGLDELFRLKKLFPDFKITCFTVPFPKEFFVSENQKHMKMSKYREWAKIINDLDWIEIGFHGFSHIHNECSCEYDKMIEMLKATENLFNNIGLKYKKIFCPPYWQISYDAMNALKDRDYVLALNRNVKREIPLGLKTYTFNWSIEEKMFPMTNKILAHGHFGYSPNVTNSLDKSYGNMASMIPINAKFGFISEDCVNNN